MRVNELSKEQLDELRERLYFPNENGKFYTGEISDQYLFNHFYGIEFVNDDFFCSKER